jgi:hypothetical protein
MPDRTESARKVQEGCYAVRVLKRALSQRVVRPLLGTVR